MDMIIHVIYDERRMEKWEPLMNEFEKHRIKNFVIWRPEERKTVVESINATHKAIVRYAKESGLDEVIIAEDDLMLLGEDGWQYFLNNKPDRFDVYISGTYLIDAPENWKPPLIKVKEWVGNHLIVVHSKYFDRFLSVPDHYHIDMAQSGLGDFFVCYPMAALQRPGFSANSMTQVNYNAQLKPEWLHQ